MIVVVMGVAGSGKSTVGRMLADALGCPFLDGDSLHSSANVEKMSRAVPLTDADRVEWLSAIRARMTDAFSHGRPLVVACSALRHAYRIVLGEGLPVVWIHLKASPELVDARLRGRTGHFMKVDMLVSQFAALEEPSDAVAIDASLSPEAIVREILAALHRPDVRVFPDLDELSRHAAAAAVETINDAVQRQERCTLVLAGGSTPRTLYRVLATQGGAHVPWDRVHVFWGDERYVPHDDARSNYRMAKEALLDHVPCPQENIHPMPTGFSDADIAARDYERTLRRYFPTDSPRFDLVLLGLGDDGHTASLFPGSPTLEERSRWVVAVQAPVEPPLRLTLTLPAFTRAGAVSFLVAGAAKRRALARVLAGTREWKACPAAGVRAGSGAVIWWVDREAAGRVPSRGES